MAVTVEKRKTVIKKGRVWSESIASGNGTAIMLPVVDRPVTLTLVAGANTGKFQHTTSLPSLVIAGTAVWEDWSQATDTGTVSDYIVSPVTAIRGVSTSGAIAIQVCV